MLHNQEDRGHAFELTMKEVVQWLFQGRNGIAVWELFVMLCVEKNQFWSREVCYRAGDGEHLVVQFIKWWWSQAG